jgi:cobalamin-dependent methionine synthase I
MPEGEVEEVAEFLMRMHFEGLITLKELDIYDHEASFHYKDEVFHIDLAEWSYPTYEEFKAELINWLEGEYSRIMDRKKRTEENRKLGDELSNWLVNVLEERRFKVKSIQLYPDEDGISIELYIEPY